jgi:hypothetical protein
LALIGCGGRGSGAAANALTVPNGNAKLVAMADVFKPRMDAAAKNLAREFGAAVDVPEDRQFLGFDAYRKAIDCLRPGDVALLTTHSAFRPVHLEYAVQKGVNVFMENSQVLQRVRHLRSRHEVRRAVLRQYPRPHGPHVQGPARVAGQHRLELRLPGGQGLVHSIPRKGKSVAGRVERAD